MKMVLEIIGYPLRFLEVGVGEHISHSW